MREALDDSELYLNDDEDTVYIKRQNREPAPKVRIQSVLLKLQLKITYISGSRPQMGKIYLWTDKRSNLHDKLGTGHIKEDITTATFPKLLLKQLKCGKSH